MTTPHIRPATAADLPALAALLARDAAPINPPEDQVWLAFDDQGQPLGTLRLRTRIGMQLPRVSYHLGCVVHAARELGLFHQQRTLLLGHDHTGSSELTDIAWLRAGATGQAQADVLRALLQAARQHLHANRAAFGERLIAELPGPRDSAGQSPFWNGLGRHFYAGDPTAAAAAHGPDWRSHVAPLLPRHPLYTSFLPAAAQAAIGSVAEHAQLLRGLLEAAGLRVGEHINVEDGGPILEARIDDLPSPVD